MSETLEGVRRAIREAGRREYARARRTIDEAKAGKPCADCGRGDLPSREMHFHHVDPATKLYPVVRATTPRAARREIAKCILLCAACHRTRHKSVSRDKSRTARFGAQLSATESTE
jgi:ssDNA-binding Zn-finger/Zn-ribbon topoisomerase 1